MARKKTKITRADGITQTYHVGTDKNVVPTAAPRVPVTGKAPSSSTASQNYGSLFNRLVANRDKRALQTQREYLANALADANTPGFMNGPSHIDSSETILLASQERVLSGWAATDLPLERKLRLIAAGITYTDNVAADTAALTDSDLDELIERRTIK
jgi:hypothetical protein